MSVTEVAASVTARAFFYPSLLWNIARNRLQTDWHWWDKITEHVLLGAIPFQSMLDDLKAQGVKAVVTLNEPFEVFIQPDVYEEHGLKHLHLPTIDFLFAPPLDKLHAGVKFIEERAAAGELTYVHCKAGRGRSTVLVLCYLIKQLGMTPEDAFCFVRNRRPQVCLAQAQWNSILEFYQSCHPGEDLPPQTLPGPVLAPAKTGVSRDTLGQVMNEGLDPNESSPANVEGLEAESVQQNSVMLVPTDALPAAGEALPAAAVTQCALRNGSCVVVYDLEGGSDVTNQGGAAGLVAADSSAESTAHVPVRRVVSLSALSAAESEGFDVGVQRACSLAGDSIADSEAFDIHVRREYSLADLDAAESKQVSLAGLEAAGSKRLQSCSLEDIPSFDSSLVGIAGASAPSGSASQDSSIANQGQPFSLADAGLPAVDTSATMLMVRLAAGDANVPDRISGICTDAAEGNVADVGGPAEGFGARLGGNEAAQTLADLTCSCDRTYTLAESDCFDSGYLPHGSLACKPPTDSCSLEASDGPCVGNVSEECGGEAATSHCNPCSAADVSNGEAGGHKLHPCAADLGVGVAVVAEGLQASFESTGNTGGALPTANVGALAGHQSSAEVGFNSVMKVDVDVNTMMPPCGPSCMMSAEPAKISVAQGAGELSRKAVLVLTDTA